MDSARCRPDTGRKRPVRCAKSPFEYLRIRNASKANRVANWQNGCRLVGWDERNSWHRTKNTGAPPVLVRINCKVLWLIMLLSSQQMLRAKGSGHQWCGACGSFLAIGDTAQGFLVAILEMSILIA